MAVKKTTTKKAPAKKASTTSISIGLGSNKAEMRKWEVESALSTLKSAEDIRKDKKMMTDIANLAKEQMNVLKNFSK
jgi:hypothetical protein